jgi:hypothetical protein
MPALSIIVPTRERADTLLHTMRTLVSQDFDSCEILVSDNDSKDNTKEVVDSFSDPRIRYVRTCKRLSMSDNWEFALQHATGDYVTYIGDDDGFIPHGVKNAMELIMEKGADALVWDKVEYCWPDHIEQTLRNSFHWRIGEIVLTQAHGRQRLGRVLEFREVYTRLPCLYNGMVRRSFLEDVGKKSRNGQFFNSIAPDVYSAIALSLVIDAYLITNYPFSVNGASRHSNGTSAFRKKDPDPSTPAMKFLAENARSYDPRIQMCSSVVTSIMGELLQITDSVNGVSIPAPRWKSYLRALVKSALSSPNPEEIYASAQHTAASIHTPLTLPATIPAPAVGEFTGGLADGILSFRMPQSLVANVFDACQIVSGMLPDTMKKETSSPLKRFARGVGRSVLTEAKTLYRAL